MDDYYERLNQAFANWNGGGEPSLEQRVENLEAEIIQKQDILTFDTEPIEDSKNPVTSGGLFSRFERCATKVALDEKVDISNFTADQERQDALEAEDRAALIAQVDGGAKNRLNYNLATFGNKSKVTINQDGSITGSITSDTRQYTWANREFEFRLPAGDYIFRIYRLVGDGVYTSARLMTAENANLCTVAVNPNIAPSMRLFTLDADTTVGFIGKLFTDTIQLMLCTSTGYKISPAFVPYRPSWQEMYDMIKALQSGS